MSVSNIVLKTHVLQHMDSSNLPTKVTEMKDNRELKYIKVELQGFQDLCNHIKELEEENKHLQEEVTRFKAKNLALTKRLQNVTLWDLSPEAQEEAGHALARSLLGGK